MRWNHKDWAPNNLCFQIEVLEKSLESLGLQRDQINQSERKSTLNIHWKDCCWSWSSNALATFCKEPTHGKISWCWETAKSQLIEKYPDAGKHWRQKEKVAAKYVMVRLHHHQLNGHKLEQILGDDGGQRCLAFYNLWSCRVRHDLATEQQQLKTQ